MKQKNIIKDAFESLSEGFYNLVQNKYLDEKSGPSQNNKKVKSANNITLEQVFMNKPLMLAKSSNKKEVSPENQILLQVD